MKNKQFFFYSFYCLFSYLCNYIFYENDTFIIIFDVAT